MSSVRSFDNPFDGLLAAVNRPSSFALRASKDMPAPASQATPNGAEPAADASSSGASAAFFSTMTESSFAEATKDRSSPIAARSGLVGAPAGEGATSPAGALSITLSPAVALILSLCQSAKGWSAGDVVARAIVLFAEDIGVPSLVTEIEARKGARHANSESADLHAVPAAFQRRAPSRFKHRD